VELVCVTRDRHKLNQCDMKMGGVGWLSPDEARGGGPDAGAAGDRRSAWSFLFVRDAYGRPCLDWFSNLQSDLDGCT
jgi:hypothetical protein